jgi:hypothetical protein
MTDKQAQAIREQIEAVLRRSAEREPWRITLETSGSTVRLHGAVSTWGEREEAEAAARDAAGVTKVENHIQILPALSLFEQPDGVPERSVAAAGGGRSWGKDRPPPERP